MTETLQNLIDRLDPKPAIRKTMDELTQMLRDGQDADGNKVADKFFDLSISQVYVTLPNGKWRVYDASMDCGSCAM